jgi:hypothetical protein
MKKILTLLMATVAFATLHAQSREENRRVILGEPKDNRTNDGRNDRDVVLGRGNNGQYPETSSSNRQYQIDQINREYNDKINSIRNNRYLSGAEKERAIRQLENDRQRRIKEIDRRYSDQNDRYAKKNNGKHKGWYKKDKNKNWKKGRNDRDDD